MREQERLSDARRRHAADAFNRWLGIDPNAPRDDHRMSFDERLELLSKEAALNQQIANDIADGGWRIITREESPDGQVITKSYSKGPDGKYVTEDGEVYPEER